MTMRWDILNFIIQKYGFKTYLEIGVQDYFTNCDKIKCDLKHAVDPFPRNKCDYIMTSDDFFASIPDDRKYDLIFIDGLHITEQVDRDIENAVAHLSPGGIIMLHDCLPTEEIHQVRYDNGGAWTGDVWKSVVKLKMFRNDLNIKVIDTDWGCGILTVEPQETYPFDITKLGDIMSWPWYVDNYRNVIPIISPEQFFNN